MKNRNDYGRFRSWKELYNDTHILFRTKEEDKENYMKRSSINIQRLEQKI